jgi:hypothetical protein
MHWHLAVDAFTDNNLQVSLALVKVVPVLACVFDLKLSVIIHTKIFESIVSSVF